MCGFHQRHFAKRGWQCRINTDGLPVWVPPKWIDPQQRPIMNHRITISNWDPNQPLDLNVPIDFSGPDEPDHPIRHRTYSTARADVHQPRSPVEQDHQHHHHVALLCGHLRDDVPVALAPVILRERESLL